MEELLKTNGAMGKAKRIQLSSPAQHQKDIHEVKSRLSSNNEKEKQTELPVCKCNFRDEVCVWRGSKETYS